MSIKYQIEIIKEKIDKEYLKKFLDKPFKEVIKFVVDIEREIIALGGELHSDATEVLIKDGSAGQNLWGGNIFPNKEGNEQIEYTSLINIKPTQENFAMEIQNEKIKQRVKKVLSNLIIL